MLWCVLFFILYIVVGGGSPLLAPAPLFPPAMDSARALYFNVLTMFYKGVRYTVVKVFVGFFDTVL